MPSRPRLCSRVTAWVGAFARITVSSWLSASVIVFCGVPSASFLFQFKTVFFDFFDFLKIFRSD